MQINISGHQIDVTDALKSYVETKVQKLERHYNEITSIHVTLSVEKQRQIAEANLHVAGNDIVANAEAEDLYAAIDALTDKLDRQLLKHKEKTLDRLQGSTHRKL